MNYLPSPTRYDVGRYRRTGRSGLHLPEISLGLWHNFGGVDVLETQRAMVRYAFDQGMTATYDHSVMSWLSVPKPATGCGLVLMASGAHANT
jgi:hypothetical protein